MTAQIGYYLSAGKSNPAEKLLGWQKRIEKRCGVSPGSGEPFAEGTVKRKKIIIVAMLFFFLAPWLRSVSSAHLCGGHVCFLSEKECTEEGHHHKEGHHHESTHGPGEGLRGHGKDGNTCFLKSGCGEDPQKSSPEETPFVVEAFFLRREEPLRENLSVEASFYREPPSFPPERPPAAA